MPPMASKFGFSGQTPQSVLYGPHISARGGPATSSRQQPSLSNQRHATPQQPRQTSLSSSRHTWHHAAGARCCAAGLQDPATTDGDDDADVTESAGQPKWTTTWAPTWEDDLPSPQMPCIEPPADHSDTANTEDAGTPATLDRLEALQAAARRDRNLSVQSVQWYPGHIARAERQLKEQLKMVDVVLEVRDARIPVATHHPQVAKWVGPKPRLLVINRQDQISPADRRAWAQHYKETGQRAFWTHGKLGDGVKGVRAVLDATSEEINAKRAKRGLAPRPVRACVIGFPNIGKSALINRLIGRRAVASAAKPGVTRTLQWVRLSGQLDLLDAPGVIPAAFNDQVAAQRLAVCNDIGEASYVDSAIAAAFIVRCKLLPTALPLMRLIRERYGVDPEEGTSETFIVGVADKMFFGNVEKAGARILKDYRAGFLGSFGLELPGDIDDRRKREVEDTAARASARAKTSTDGFATSF